MNGLIDEDKGRHWIGAAKNIAASNRKREMNSI
jgi:hypothetical protein